MAIPVRTKQEVVSEFRSGEILDAARKVFAEKGFAGTTMEEIAERSGLAKGTLYLYFPSKQDIYIATLKRGFAGVVEHTRAAMAAAGSLRAKIKAFVETRFEALDRDRDFLRIYYAEFGNLAHTGCSNPGLRELYERQLKNLEEMLRVAVEAGEMRPLPVDAAAVALYETTRGWLWRMLLIGSPRTPQEDIEVLTDILWKGIGQ